MRRERESRAVMGRKEMYDGRGRGEGGEGERERMDETVIPGEFSFRM